MTDDGSALDDKPGKTLRLSYRVSLGFLLVIVGVWISCLIMSLPRYRIVYEQLGMTEPGYFIQALLFLAPVLNVISAATPIVTVLLLISGGPVLKHGSRQTMKRMLAANVTFGVVVIGIWCLLHFVL